MRGKYSPTVTAAYMKDQEWWDKYANPTPRVYYPYDPEGYDSYGYNCDEVDRAGNSECDYYPNDNEYGDNFAYETALTEWVFDGVKPLRKTT
jgi:hypothetical protein